MLAVSACLLTTLTPIVLSQSASALNCVTPTESSYLDGSDSYTVQTFTNVANNCDWTVPAGVTSIGSVIVGGGDGAAKRLVLLCKGSEPATNNHGSAD